MSEGTDAAADFRAMMAGAADQAYAEADEAPYGWTIDPVTKEKRPKKSPGRPRKPPALDELKAGREDQDAGDAGRPADRAPETPKRGRRRRERAEHKPKETYPQFREGQIEKGVNRLYRKAGKILAVWDAEVGAAVIESTRAEDEDDLTVGRAWEEVCRHNPRIRRFVLRMMTGGAYGQLAWSHAPIVLAVLMKDSVRSRLPLPRLADAFLSADEEGDSPADGTVFDGLTPEDMQQAMAFAQQMMPQAFNGRVVPNMRVPEPPAGD